MADLGLFLGDLDGDDKINAMTSHALNPGVGQSTDLISLIECNPIRLVKDEEELRVHIKSLTLSQM